MVARVKAASDTDKNLGRIHPHSLLELRLVGFTQADTMEWDIEKIHFTN